MADFYGYGGRSVQIFGFCKKDCRREEVGYGVDAGVFCELVIVKMDCKVIVSGWCISRT